jgi:hypothetical protein
VILLGLAWIRPDAVRLPIEHGVSWLLIGGGLLMGAGSALNGGCFVGSIVRIGSGDLNFLATLIGIGVGLRLMDAFASQFVPGDADVIRREAAGSLGYAVAWLTFLAVGIGAAAVAWRRNGVQGLTLHGRWPRSLTLSATGILAGLMFARNPDWTYATTIEALAYADRAPIGWPPLIAPIALFLGAMSSSHASGRFRLQLLRPAGALRCLSGGVLMGIGAGFIPGGNDTLLLWAIPGLTIYGTVAYAVMASSIAVAMVAARGIQK